MRLLVVSLLQWFSCFIAIFSLLVGFQLGTNPLAALCGLGFLAGVWGFAFFTRRVSEEVNG